MRASALEQEMISDNLANVNTPGFKRSSGTYRSFNDKIVQANNNLIGTISGGITHHQTNFDFSQGSLKMTNNPLDIAVGGEGLLPMMTVDNDVMYTRNGHFTLDKFGYIVNGHGDRLLDASLNPVMIDSGKPISDISISKDGSLEVDGTFLTTLATFKPDLDGGMISSGGRYFIAGGSYLSVAENDTLHQGFLEESNVSAVQMSADMIRVSREYEANQTALKRQAQTLSTLMNAAQI